MRTLKRDLEQMLHTIEGPSDRPELLNMWKGLFDCSVPPNISTGMLRMALAYRAQSKAYGGLKQSTRVYLRQIAQNALGPAPPTPEVPLGTKLVREWHGRTYGVSVEADGVYMKGQKYRSLSDVAETITGVRWSGPRFFGLRKVKSK